VAETQATDGRVPNAISVVVKVLKVLKILA
jgi:hypothetical protein